MTPEEIKQAEKICAEATPVPWWHKEEARPTFDYPVTYRVVHLLRPLGENCVSDELVMRSKSDAAFVAGARTLLPKALAEIKRLRALDTPRDHDRYLIERLTKERDALKVQLAGLKAETRVRQAGWNNCDDERCALRAENESLKAQLAEAKEALGILKHDLRDIWCIEKERYGGGDRAKYLMDVAATALAKLEAATQPPCNKPHHMTHTRRCERCGGSGHIATKGSYGDSFDCPLCDGGKQLECDEADCESGCAEIACTCDAQTAKDGE